jgi:hypothetical protein
VSVYLESPAGQTGGPVSIVAVPKGQESRFSGADFRRTDLPAQVQLFNHRYYVMPGDVAQLNPPDVTPLNKSVSGYQAFVLRGAPPSAPYMLYLRPKPDEKLYIPYQQVMGGEGA